jgi:hypothetical protein
MSEETITPVTAIPASIVKAICKIHASVDAVAKSQRNAHGGYQFASTDDIYAAITRKLGEVGMIIMPLETKHEIVKIEKEGKTVQWLHACFSFVLATEDATWEHPSCRRSLYIQVTGPQTHQAAQSYAEKAFLRSLFKLPTGDMDLDSMPQGDTEEDQIALNGNGKKRKSSAEGKRDGSVKRFNEIRAAIQNAASIDHMRQIKTLYAEDWEALPRAWADTLGEDYEVKMTEMEAQEAA